MGAAAGDLQPLGADGERVPGRGGGPGEPLGERAADDVGAAEEPGGVGRRRLGVEGLGRPLPHHAPRPHEGHPVAQGERLGLVVRDPQARRPEVGLERLDLGPRRLAERGVEVREGLVEQEDLGLDGDRAGERDALLLAARERRDGPVVQPAQVDAPEGPPRPLAGLGPLGPGHPQPVGHVLADGHRREQGVRLEHHRRRPRLRRPPRDVGPSHADGPGVGRLEPADEPEQRRLPAPRRAQERHERARGHGQRDAVDGGHVAVALDDAVDLDGGERGRGRGQGGLG